MEAFILIGKVETGNYLETPNNDNINTRFHEILIPDSRHLNNSLMVCVIPIVLIRKSLGGFNNFGKYYRALSSRNGF
jgi:hypothetical protein